MPSAIVVGPRSMLGACLIEQLRDAGWQVRTAGRHPGCDLPLDLGSAPWPDEPLGFSADALFHCAAAFGDDSPQGRWLNERVNALGAHQVVDLAKAAGCHAVVYAGTLSSCYRDTPDERDAYGASKARGEEILAAGLKRLGIGFCSLRFPQLYDLRGECVAHQPWFGRLIAYAAAGRSLRLPGGDARRNFLFVGDAARLMHAAATSNWRGVQIATHPVSQRYAEIAERAYALFGRGGSIEIAPEKQPFREVCISLPGTVLVEWGLDRLLSMEEGLQRIKASGHGERFGPLDVD